MAVDTQDKRRSAQGLHAPVPDALALSAADRRHVAGVYRFGSGWEAATGTASRSTFDTATVTVEGAAQRLKALIDDLLASGTISAG